MPFFSIVVPTCRRDAALQECLQRLVTSEPRVLGVEYEIIVTDDGNQDSTRKLVESGGAWCAQARWVRGPGKGPAANRNNGASVARGEWLIFTDDDCLPTEKWLGAFFNAIATTPKIRVLEGRTFADRPRRSFGEVSPINERGGLLWSCNMVVKRTLFQSMGGFDERFPFAAMEDVDFKYRLDLQKEPVLFVPEAAVCHPWRKDAGWKGHIRHEKSTLIYLSLHPEEFRRLNSQHYLKCSVRFFVKDTIPGIFRYRCRGLVSEMLRHVAYWRAAFVVGAAKWKYRAPTPAMAVPPPLTGSTSGTLNP